MFKFFKIILTIELKIFFLPLIFLIIDQATKSIIFLMLFDEMNKVIIFSFLNLTPVWNKGISFGMFSNSGEIGRIIFIFIGIIFGVLIPIFTNGWNKS